MEDLILYDANLHKKAIIRNCIDYDCAVGRNAYSDNDFILKTPFDKDKLYEVGEWVCFGYTEYGGVIRSRTIDTKSETVTYKGSTLRGVLAHLPMCSKTSGDSNDGKKTGTPTAVMNWALTDAYVDYSSSGDFGQGPDSLIETTSEITSQADVGTYSTNGFGYTNYLYLNDNIVKRFSTVLNQPVKSRFSLKNRKINIEYLYGNTYYYDSSKVKLLYAYNADIPNVCIMSTKKISEFKSYLGYLWFNSTHYIDEDGNVISDEEKENWVAYNDVSKCIALIGGIDFGLDSEVGTALETLESDSVGNLADAQEKPSTEIEVDTEEAEVDDVIVASIAELNMKVTKRVVETRLKISNGIPKITYTLEG